MIYKNKNIFNKCNTKIKKMDLFLLFFYQQNKKSRGIITMPLPRVI